MEHENRKRKRQQFHYPAYVDFCDGTPARPCQLSDVSETGARLAIESANDVPQQFALLLTEDGKTRRWCSVVWRSETQIGVEFLAAPTVKRPSNSDIQP